MSDASLIPDSITATLGDLVGLYSQVETIKLNNQIAKAKASASAFDAATVSKNQQAYANAPATPAAGVNPWLVVGGVLAVGLVVLLVAK